MRCLSCQYDLSHLIGPPHRCPECGRKFDPNKSLSPGPTSRLALVAFLVAICVVFFGSLIWRLRASSNNDGVFLIDIIAAGFDAILITSLLLPVTLGLYLVFLAWERRRRELQS